MICELSLQPVITVEADSEANVSHISDKCVDCLQKSVVTLQIENAELKRIIAESQKQEPVAWFTTYADGRLKELVALSQCTADDLMAYGMFLTPLFTKTIIQGETK